MAAAIAKNTSVENEDASLPSWLVNHTNIEWDSDDVDALLTSIDASQSPDPSTLPHLPAEILMQILEYVPVAYVLDWRLICRGFRNAIDGPILYHHLQRTQLVGFLGPKASSIMRSLTENEYQRLHLVPARFWSIEKTQSPPNPHQHYRLAWDNPHAIFKMSSVWWANYKSHIERPSFPSKSSMLSRLKLCRTDQGYGALTWAIKLDTAILDLDLPLDPNRQKFDVDIDTKSRIVRVEWKPMLFRFLKTERALRLLMEKKHESTFTFSHTEDCLRAVRRQRLHAALNPEIKTDRRIKWSLRLLPPLWGTGGPIDPSSLDHVEADAVGILLLLRREAALSDRQTTHLWQLAYDYMIMITTLNRFSRSLRYLKQQLILPGNATTLETEVSQHVRVPSNPIAWSDELRVNIETRVQKWRTQQKLIEQMQALMVASQEALAVPEDAFDAIDTDF